MNATESPLLRCPPEVRNRIWYFALCGKTVHLTGRKVAGRLHIHHAVCQAKIQDSATSISDKSVSSVSSAEWKSSEFDISKLSAAKIAKLKKKTI